MKTKISTYKFWKLKQHKWSPIILLSFLFVGVFADFLANDKPIFAIENGRIIMPIFQKEINLLNAPKPYYTFVIYPPIPYSDRTIDQDNMLISPFAKQNVVRRWKRHWLGTSILGKDMTAMLIYGARRSLMIGFGSMLIAGFIGIFIGGVAGYFGNKTLRYNFLDLIIGIIKWGLIATASILIIQWKLLKLDGSPILVFYYILFLLPIFLILKIIKKKNKHIRNKLFPLDFIILKFIEIFESIPTILFLFMIIATVDSFGILQIIFVIGFIYWPFIAKYQRSETLKIVSLPFIEFAKTSGLSNFLIFKNHILPNTIKPVLVHLSFGVAISILAESSLSFLGIGLDSNIITWGNILAVARQYPYNWWIVLFPGLCITILVFSLNRLYDR